MDTIFVTLLWGLRGLRGPDSAPSKKPEMDKEAEMGEEAEMEAPVQKKRLISCGSMTPAASTRAAGIF